MQAREHDMPLSIDALKRGPIPRHIAIIMDGNGRWAKARGLARMFGHRAGVESLETLLTTVKDLGIGYVTVYAFSTENWKRPEQEVSGLMTLLIEFLHKKRDFLMKEGIRLHAIGDTAGLPVKVQASLGQVQEVTRTNTDLVFNLALNYGGRQEIIRACQALAGQVKAGDLALEDITEDVFSGELYTKGQPDPDLLIRTSGEERVSNFLLWQIAYSEIWITETYWPDFTSHDLLQAVAAYQRRDRRFGGLSKST